MPLLPRVPPASAGASLGASVGAAVLVGGGVSFWLGPMEGALIGWVAAGLVFLLWTWLALWPLSGQESQSFAAREDPSRGVRDLVLLAGAAVAVASVVTVALQAKDLGAARTILRIACLGVSWAVLHTVFALTYARDYYSEPVGGIDFGSREDVKPAYRDFAYLAFTIGMTFQVSDTQVSESDIRSRVLRHAMVSFLFGTILIAVTINVIAGVGR